METELKFALSPESRRAIERVFSPGAEETAKHHDVSIYFDTPDLRLHKAGFSLRVRRRSDREDNVQTLKAAGRSAMERQEWEWPVPGEQPDRSHFGEVPGLADMLDGDGIELKPVFRTEVDRAQQVLHPRPGATVELAFDEGVIIAGERRERLNELEIELKEGPEDSLLELALELVHAAHLPLLIDSKAVRGYRLRGGERAVAHKAKAGAVSLAPGCASDEAFGRLVGARLDGLLANQSATLSGDAVEGVHQMRVTVRQLRSLLVLFEPILEPESRERFDGELKRLGAVLGQARDWDVFVDETLPAAVRAGVELERIQPLRHVAVERRDAAHRWVKGEIGSPFFTRLVLALRVWSRPGGPALLAKRAKRTLRDAAPGLLDRLERKLGRRLRASDPDDATSLHEVRKSAKKLRYAIEYFEGVFGEQSARYLESCDRLQKRLGRLNDLETASLRARELAQDAIELTPAQGCLAQWTHGRRAKPLKKALKAERAFTRAKPFWA